MTQKRWDIFCKIVDNFGDIGVCWRLCQILADTHQIKVRLFIDDFRIASKIIPQFDDKKPQQTIGQVEIMAWPSEINALEKISLPDVVIENFSCQLPESYVDEICAHHQKSQTPFIWINLDYLSAELWVESCHALPSIHPTLGVKKTYFYPGFTKKTGGLLREQNLVQTRDTFVNSPALQTQFWQQHRPNDPPLTFENTIKISLFSYPQADIKNLILMLLQCKKPIHIFLPFNSEITALHAIIEEYHLQMHAVKTMQKISLHLLPFLSQTEYDQLLWACDLNFVRGEDSWVRAIWAGKPFIWQPYIQEENAHLTKLDAFLSMYTQTASAATKTLIQEAHHVWSNAQLQKNTDFWCHVMHQLADWQTFSMRKSNELAEQLSLTEQLVHFTREALAMKI